MLLAVMIRRFILVALPIVVLTSCDLDLGSKRRQRVIQLNVEHEKVQYEIELLADRIEKANSFRGMVNERYKQHLADQNRLIELQVQLRGIEKELELLTPGKR